MELNGGADVQKVLYDAIARERGIAAEILDPNTTLEQLDLSSIDTVMMFFDIENELGVELDQSKLQDLSTLEDLTLYLQSVVAAK